MSFSHRKKRRASVFFLCENDSMERSKPEESERFFSKPKKAKIKIKKKIKKKKKKKKKIKIRARVRIKTEKGVRGRALTGRSPRPR